MTLPRPIRGIIPPVLTPLSDRDTLDAAAFDRLLEHLITGCSSALFILGSTGEAPGLSCRLRRAVMEAPCTHSLSTKAPLEGITPGRAKPSGCAASVGRCTGQVLGCDSSVGR